LSEQFSLRPARKEEARALAQLIDIAGEGFGTYLWSQAAGPGESALDVGMRRAQRDEGGFSYKNAVVAESGGKIAGLLLGYRLADPYDTGDLDRLPPLVRPLVELESIAPASWYVNALAAFPEFRNKGLGTQCSLKQSGSRAKRKRPRSASLWPKQMKGRSGFICERATRRPRGSGSCRFPACRMRATGFY
jgi:hypothetical protein